MTAGIAEVVERTGLTRDTLRWYEREGLIPPVDRDPSGYRAYSDATIGLIQLIVRLRRTGMPVEHMRRFDHYADLIATGRDCGDPTPHHPTRPERSRS
ncbi:MAG: MerR family transcriptional regulator [Acidimicrobiales bacterium]